MYEAGGDASGSQKKKRKGEKDLVPRASETSIGSVGGGREEEEIIIKAKK